MSRRSFAGRTVVITGAAGGLGKALVERFGRAGARIGAIDVREDALLQAAEDWRRSQIRVETAVADCTDEQQVGVAAARIERVLGQIYCVVNNAGITHVQDFAPDQTRQVKRLMDVNFHGAVHATAACWDSVVRHEGLFVTISSVAGFAPLLGRTGYCASKHALHGFFDTLRLELRGSGAGVLMVCPSFIATGIRRHLDLEPTDDGRRLGVRDEATPESVADQIFRAARRDRRLLVVGRVGRAARVLRRWLPGLYERLMIRSMRP